MNRAKLTARSDILGEGRATEQQYYDSYGLTIWSCVAILAVLKTSRALSDRAHHAGAGESWLGTAGLLVKGARGHVAKRAAAVKSAGRKAGKSNNKPSAVRAISSSRSSAVAVAKAPSIRQVKIADKGSKLEKPGSRVGSTGGKNLVEAAGALKLAKKKAAKAAKAAGVKFPNNAPVPPPPVPTDGKPRKNQAGLTPRELEHYRELLLAKRRELVGDMHSMETEALRSTSGTNLSNLPLHMADMGTDNYEQEFTLGLVEKDRNLLREINQALAKIQNGSYGICEGTGLPISKVRLEAYPWAKYSVEYARMKEKGVIPR